MVSSERWVEGEVTPQVRYASAIEIWRFFAAWREKIVAGYLAVLAALGVAFSHYQAPGPRCAVLGAAIVASLVFWILDVRNVYFLNVAQAAASRLEGEASPLGCFGALEKRLDPAKSAWGSLTMPTYAQAYNILVASIVGGSIGGLFVFIRRLHASGHLLDSGLPAAAAVAAGGAILLTLVFAEVRTMAWMGEKSRRDQAKASPQRAVEQGDEADKAR
jgi:hypothetical protein